VRYLFSASLSARSARALSVRIPTLSFVRDGVLFAASIILTRPLHSRSMPSSLSSFSLEFSQLSTRAYPIYSPDLQVRAVFF